MFDLTVLANSINHLDESAVVSLERDQDARDAYLDLFKKMHQMLSKGGSLDNHGLRLPQFF